MQSSGTKSPVYFDAAEANALAHEFFERQQARVEEQLGLMLEQTRADINYCLRRAPQELVGLLLRWQSLDSERVKKLEELIEHLIVLSCENKFPSPEKPDNGIESQESINKKDICQAFCTAPFWKELQGHFKKYKALSDMRGISKCEGTAEQKIINQRDFYTRHRNIITAGAGIWGCLCQALEQLFSRFSRVAPASSSMCLFPSSEGVPGAFERTRLKKELSVALHSSVLKPRRPN